MTEDFKHRVLQPKEPPPPAPCWIWFLAGMAVGGFFAALILLKVFTPAQPLEPGVKGTPSALQTPSVTTPGTGDPAEPGPPKEIPKPVVVERVKFNFYSLLPEVGVIPPQGDFQPQGKIQGHGQPLTGPVSTVAPTQPAVSAVAPQEAMVTAQPVGQTQQLTTMPAPVVHSVPPPQVAQPPRPPAIQQPPVEPASRPVGRAPQGDGSLATHILSPERPTAQPPTAVVSPPPPERSGDGYVLQIGSFRQVGDAERLRGRLALIGIIAEVRRVTLDSGEIYYRVLSGPYASATLSQVQRRLSENELNSLVLPRRN